MKENKFREYKKIIIDTTHELESVIAKLKEVQKMQYEFIAEEELLTNEQEEEIMEYESIAKECLDYMSSL